MFDAAYADKLYEDYKRHSVDDSAAMAALAGQLAGKQVLVLAPGPSLREKQAEISEYIARHKPVVIAANFVPQEIAADYVFFSNNKRFSKIETLPCTGILTSNLESRPDCLTVDYNRLAGAFAQGDNSLILLLRLLHALGAQSAALAGADGYRTGRSNYASSSMHSHVARDADFNRAMREAIQSSGIPCTFLTPSEYEAE